MTAYTPTEQQNDIFAAGLAGKSIIITARAGCAKTTTLEGLAERMPEGLRGCYLAFNVRVKKEAEEKFPPWVQCLTLNGLGHRAWAGALSGKQIKLLDGRNNNPRKDQFAVEQYLLKNKLSASFDEKRNLSTVLNAARTLGLCPKGLHGAGFLEDTDESWQHVFAWCEADLRNYVELLPMSRGVLRYSIEMAQGGLIDFVDQIYMPTTFGGRWPSFDVVFGDETQDFSPANHKMVSLVQAPQKIMVGDPKQAIYAFRGAMSDSMDHLESVMPEGTEWVHLKLTKTFRCGKAIVERQQKFCPDFTAAETNAEGRVLFWPVPCQCAASHPGSTQDCTCEGTTDIWTSSMVPDGSAILCRNNAPLISCALRFLAAKRRVTVLGRDFADRLRKDIKKAMGRAPLLAPIREVHKKVKVFYESKLDRSKAPTEAQLEEIQDRVAAVVALSEGCETLADLFSHLDRIFSDDVAPVTLATGHKAKGLEWDFVVHLNPGLIPARWALDDPVALAQEHNLAYVIETRAKKTLVLADLSDLDA